MKNCQMNYGASMIKSERRANGRKNKGGISIFGVGYAVIAAIFISALVFVGMCPGKTTSFVSFIMLAAVIGIFIGMFFDSMDL